MPYSHPLALQPGIAPGTPVLLQTRVFGGGATRILLGGTDNDKGPGSAMSRATAASLVTTVVDEVSAAPITIIQNWQPPPR